MKVYVACLTPFADNPDMWASEFGGFGHGASIEFEMLDEVRNYTDRGVGLFEVEYDMKRLRVPVQKLMGRVLSAARSYPPLEQRHGIVTSGLFRVAATAASLAKDKGSDYQKEWRFVIVPGRDEKREPRNIETHAEGKKPRTDFMLRANSDDRPVVTRIVLGPNIAPDKIDEARAALTALGYGAGKGEILIAAMEIAFIQYQQPEVQEVRTRQWDTSWAPYIDSWLENEPFRKVWDRSGTQYDKSFYEYMQSRARALASDESAAA